MPEALCKLTFSAVIPRLVVIHRKPLGGNYADPGPIAEGRLPSEAVARNPVFEDDEEWPTGPPPRRSRGKAAAPSVPVAEEETRSEEERDAAFDPVGVWDDDFLPIEPVRSRRER